MAGPWQIAALLAYLLLASSSKVTALNSAVNISATPDVLGTGGDGSQWVTVKFSKTKGAAIGDWIAVFSPAKFNGGVCFDASSTRDDPPYICSAPIKFAYANSSSENYVSSGKGSIAFHLINMRSDYAFGFYSGGFDKPVLEGVSNTIEFQNPKAPQWPRLASGKAWNEMTITWTSGYIDTEAIPLVVWKWEAETDWKTTIALTNTYDITDMCGPPANTKGWRHPGYIHTAYLKGLASSVKYMYKVGHKLASGKFVWGEDNWFKSAPSPGRDTQQAVVFFGDMGKLQRDGSLQYRDTQHGALNTTRALVNEINAGAVDYVIHNGDVTYADGYLAQWDTFVDMISNITKRVPYMIGIGNHERDYPGTGSWYTGHDSGGECGVVTPTQFNMPGENPDKLWYSASWGLFKFCVANSEIDWQIGSEQWKWLDHCLSSTDRQRQPWLIFTSHRVLGYSSAADYQGVWGTTGEPMGRDNLQPLWQKYKVDLAMYGHVHNYERTCPVYQSVCASDESYTFTGKFNGTIHMVVGTAGRDTEPYGAVNVSWSIAKDYALVNGYLKMTAKDRNNLLVEFKHNDGYVADNFTIYRQFQDVLGCDNSIAPICPPVSSVDYS